MDYTRYRRPSAWFLLALAVVLAAAATTAFVWDSGSGGLVLLARAGENLVVLGWLILIALTGALLLGMAKSAARLALCTTLLVLGIPFLLLAGLVSVLSGLSWETKSEAAPGRSDRQLVVERGTAMIDPFWYVYVDQGSLPLARRWAVGYFNGDDPDDELREAVWTAPDRIRMTTTGGEVLWVTVAPDGRPDRLASPGW
ncbi:hypothetical protein ACFXB3_24510 [Streptomyces sp. NPDC059447]|uniref:hypothetical protein n=1 Tax=Streptomyces sp. NPDC059447 TaxID=3346834 RepID=UPI0036C33F5F